MADELANLRKRVEELMQQNEELEEMVVEKDNTIKELASAQGKIVEDMELKMKELKDIISEKEGLRCFCRSISCSSPAVALYFVLLCPELSLCFLQSLLYISSDLLMFLSEVSRKRQWVVLDVVHIT